MLSQAVILCGGLGTRLGALTADTPKPLLPVAGRPFLDHLIQEVARYGVRRITLLAGRFGEKVASAFDGKRLHGAQIEVLIEPEPMGTGGALRYARPFLDPIFFLLNGDSWIDADLVQIALAWQRAREVDPAPKAQLLLQHVSDAGRFGSVTLETPGEAAGRVLSFHEKSRQSAAVPGLINAGVYILDRTLVEDLPAEGALSLESDVLPARVAARQVWGVTAPRNSYFIDIGLPSTFSAAQTEFVRHRTRPAIFLDRDGTLNIDRGYTYRPDDLEWTPGAPEAIALANRLGWFVFVVTNQAGIAHGYYDAEAVHNFHAAMQADLFRHGAHIDAFEFCPFHPDAALPEWKAPSRRRKPAPGMIEDLLAAWPVDRPRSFLIGDRDIDVQAAEAAGLDGVLYTGGSLLDLVRRKVKERIDVDQ